MSEKKHVFKIVPDAEIYNFDGRKFHTIKLSDKDENEISLGKYLGMYQGYDDSLNEIVYNQQFETVSYGYPIRHFRPSKVQVELDSNCEYQFKLYENNNNQLWLPKSSLHFDKIVNLKEYHDKNDSLEFKITNNIPEIHDKDGKRICVLQSHQLLIDGNNVLQGVYEILKEDGLDVHVAIEGISYVTVEKNGDCNYSYYLSDQDGNKIDTATNSQGVTIDLNQYNPFLESVLQESSLQDLLHIYDMDGKELQILSRNLTDTQLQTLVEHLTEHQLKTIAQDLNETKLKIIVPALNEAQLEALVKDLKPDQVKDILPHLKMEQFKALTQNLSNEQFTELAQDLAEHHLTILSKQLEGDQLKALVNGLEGDKLKDLINKLDHDKLQTIAQDLTDTDRIQIIVESLITNPEKLQAFANSISNQQFTDLLNKLDSDTLIKVIHNLPHEKVVSAIGKLENKEDQSDIVKMLKEQIEKQNEKQDKMMEMLEEALKEKSTGEDEGVIPDTTPPNFDDLLYSNSEAYIHNSSYVLYV